MSETITVSRVIPARAERIENGEDIAGVFDPTPLYAQITRASLQAAAQHALTKNRYVQVILRPEK